MDRFRRLASKLKMTARTLKAKPEVPRGSSQAYPNVSVVLGFQAVEGFMMHAFGFQATAIQDAGFPAQAFPDPIGPPRRPIHQAFALRSIR